MLKRVVVGSAIAATSWYAFYRATTWWKTWGVDAAESELALPGDDLVPDATMTDTRGITIDAPPSAVWPWLVQLGYGRGGWYSYDRLDMRGRSADSILPEFQSLAVGDTIPTDPGGGFEVKIVEPERALVVLIDQDIAARRRSAGEATCVTTGEGPTTGLEASGRFMQASMPPEFAVSWTIALQPLDGDRTRLIERLRGSFGQATAGSRAFGPLLGLGMFVMTQRQMLGLKERAERLAQGQGTVPAPAPAASDNGQAPEGATVPIVPA